MKKSLFILFLLLLPVLAPLFNKGYFPIHDDLQVVRQLEMENCFKDLQIPCRWVNDLGYGYGYPLFVYYPPLPYLLGEIFRVFHFSYIDTVKIVGGLGFVGAAVAMYFLGREVWNEKGGVLASALYLYAPYRAVNFYVRAAVNEFWASVFFPVILLAIYKIIVQKNRKWILGLALGFAGLMLSHNQMLLIFIPVIVGWTVYLWLKERSLRSVISLALGSFWGLGLAGFYFIPVLLEQKYAHLETLVIGYFNYLAHFLDLSQIFLRINWGYGSSVYGSGDTMSFALGYAQWLIPLLSVLLILFFPKLRKYWFLILTLGGLGLWSLFMTHSKSTFIWMIAKPLEFLQFPWRFLSVSIFIFSLLGGALGVVISKRVLGIMLLLVIITNANYFRPRIYSAEMTDADKFTGHTWYLMTTNGIFDYLPKGAAFPPADPPGGNLSILNGKGTYSTVFKKSNQQKYQVNLEQSSLVQIETYYFPGWQVYVDNKRVELDPVADKLLGRMQVVVPEGSHEIVAKFTNTPDRLIGNMMSIVSWALVLGIIGLWSKKRLKLRM